MKLSEAIVQIKTTKASQFDDKTLTAWISELDGQLHNTVIRGRENPPANNTPYTVEEDSDTELLVAFPYDQIYVYWLMAKIDFFNQEFDRYSNDMALYNQYYNAFASLYVCDHAQTSSGESYI